MVRLIHVHHFYLNRSSLFSGHSRGFPWLDGRVFGRPDCQKRGEIEFKSLKAFGSFWLCNSSLVFIYGDFGPGPSLWLGKTRASQSLQLQGQKMGDAQSGFGRAFGKFYGSAFLCFDYQISAVGRNNGQSLADRCHFQSFVGIFQFNAYSSS